VAIVNPAQGKPVKTWRRPSSDPDGEKLRRFQAVTNAAPSDLPVDEMLAKLLERTRQLLTVDTTTILLVDEAGKDLVATASSSLEEEVRAGVRVPIGRGSPAASPRKHTRS
jgi:hypothetical protein